MSRIPGYEVFEKLYQSNRSLIYRAQRISDQVPVVLKILRQEYPTPAAIARFRMEYDIIRSLDLVGVIKAYGLETDQQSPVMILEDFGGESLQTWLQQRPFDLEEFLILAIQVTTILSEIHGHQITHKDINPSNIVRNPATGQVKIIDFGIATVLSRENLTLRHPAGLEGTLAYLSPEQTGRMNRSVDYRTDFYSLGVTFYQLLCDRLPFAATDALELVHCHLAKQPIPPHQVNPAISRPVSDLVMKLLAKTAEDRYQSAHGITADLQACLNQLQQSQRIEWFPIGRWDISSKFQIPQKLYGREREVERLLQAFTSNSDPTPAAPNPLRSQLILISGHPGIGKTTLIQELYRSITGQRGYLVTGKYEQLQRNIPYSGLIQAFQALVRQLLTETEEQIQVWRSRLLAALGDNGQLIRDVIPEVELIIGSQPSPPELPPAESQNRFHFIFEKFIRAFTQAVNPADSGLIQPLVIFLDDLQWADSASLQLIQHLLLLLNDPSFLLIAAYRDQEIHFTTSFHQLLVTIQNAGVLVQQIVLSPLGVTDVNQLLQDTLHCESEQSLPFAALTTQKTDGNPFLIKEFLRFLHQEQLLYFNAKQGIWQWDLQQIQAAQLPENLAELVMERMQKLPTASQQALSLAACIGSQFDLQTLAIISQRSQLAMVADLQIAIQQSLITPIGDDYKYLASYLPTGKMDVDITYQFLHDRIQQSAYRLIPEANKPQYHLKIGQLLLKSTPNRLLEARIFAIVDHLNIGVALITEQDQRYELARLNWLAGQKAKTSIAYGSALEYLNTARSLLPENSWQDAYELTLALCEATAQAAYLVGDFQQMEQRIEEVFNHTETVLERKNVYLIKIQACIAQNRLMDAIQTALQALDQLAIKLPLQPDSQDITQGLREVQQILAEKSIEGLADLPRMVDPDKLAAMEVITSVCTPTYFLAPDLWKLMVFQKIQLSVRYGNAPGSAFGYADYGMILCGIAEDIATSCQFSQLAETLQPQLNAKEFMPKTTLLVNTYLKHWQGHLQETLNPLLEAYQCGLETGDLEYATFAIAYRCYHAYLIGRELSQLEQEISRYEVAMAQFKQGLPLHLLSIYHQSVLNLMGQSADPCCLTHSCLSENHRLPQSAAVDEQSILFHLSLNQLILSYLFHDTAQVAACVVTTNQLLSAGAVGLLTVPVFHFYDSLARIAIFAGVPAVEQPDIFEEIAGNQRKIKHWAEYAPMNYLHKFYLVEAEQCRILHHDAEAADAYDRAIALAQEHGYIQEAALANELAGRFYLAKGRTKIAQMYLLEARRGYWCWGAMAKVNDLDQRYSQCCDRWYEPVTTGSDNQSGLATVRQSTGAAALDWAALMKASQALSGEIVLERLLTKLMTILMEHAGAQRGCLLLENKGQLCIEAEADVQLGHISVLQAIPLDSEIARNWVCLAIVHYVTRTQESVVLNQAFQDSRFNQDAYIREQRPKSILCTPLVYQGKHSGILYLENNLTTDAFTPGRLEVLQFLSTQAAISIDNAQLYSQLELRVQARTGELSQINDRLQAEILERQRSEQTLRMIVEGTASVTGEDFFRSLVRSLAQALGVRYALVSECVDALPTRVRSFAFWQGDEFGDQLEYDLQGTPCERIINSKSCQCFPEQIQAFFPEDAALVEMQAQSYAGIALLGSTGNLLGHLAVLDDQLMENQPRTQALLEIFAARAAAEIERKQAEDALRISETKFSTAFRSSPDAITISTFNDGCYVEMNDSCLRMLGYGREEMLGCSAAELGVWSKPEEWQDVQKLLQQQGTVANLEVTLRRKSGEIFPALFSAEVIHLEDELCLLSVAVDITMLKQAEKALARLAEIGELAAMIVHEVRNPLTTIAMGLNSFKKLQLSQRFQEYLSLSLDEADRLQRLLNQILLYARPQTLQRSPLELNQFMAEMLTSLQAMPVAVGKSLRFAAMAEPVNVLADRDQLKQVVINLVSNACEAVNSGEMITVQMQKLDHQVCIQVHNSGEPIPTEVLSKLTKPFFTTKVSGTGLGLAIVKRIVEAHDGALSIESSAATGTCVTVCFPYAKG